MKEKLDPHEEMPLSDEEAVRKSGGKSPQRPAPAPVPAEDATRRPPPVLPPIGIRPKYEE